MARPKGCNQPIVGGPVSACTFDTWMEKNHPEKPFERYADDIVVHCKTEKQHISKSVIEKRMRSCKLELHPDKTKVVHFRVKRVENTHEASTFGIYRKVADGPHKSWSQTHDHIVISRKAGKPLWRSFVRCNWHKMRGNIERLSKELTPVVRA
jgi:hypothetical protein